MLRVDQPSKRIRWLLRFARSLARAKLPAQQLALVVGPFIGGEANPAFTYQISGFKNGETSSVVSGSPSLSTTAIATSPIGPYPITVSIGSLTAVNYQFNLVNGTLTVKALTLNGFFQPTDMGGVLNTVKAGSTVPLKWKVFAGSTELTSTTMIKSVTQIEIACQTLVEAAIEEVVTTTGGTALRYDTTSGQFIDNWASPKNAAGRCYRVTMTTQDLSTLVALFKLK